MSLRLDWCSHEAAEFAAKQWHYSGCLSVGRQNFVGVWEDERFIGAIVFARSSSPNLGDMFGLTQWECLELTRVALCGHEAPVTRMIARALKMLKQRNPGLRLVVSFADTRQGHHGGIYQGGNWLYMGTSSPRLEFLIAGKWRTDTHAWKIRTEATPSRRIPGKHKYLYPLDDEMRARIAPLAKPYPKRVRSIDSDAPGFQPGKGGAIPTRTLHD